MSVLNQSGEEPVECPLCMEQLEVDDLNFHPCTCGYQICRFCWHRIRTDENGLCPACRRAYSENPANFRPLTTSEVQRLKAEKRMREQQRKQKVIESRQHLAAVRVVQKNLVFVLGLPARLTDAEVLKKHEYFGKFGRIQKVVINQSTSYAGTQGPSASAYVTYHRSDDALRAISAVNNTLVDSRSLKVSLGTTKYCSNFLKNQQCPRAECMYLHDLGDSEASFTKEDMQQGKHQEYERKLYDQMLINTSSNQVRESSDNPPKATVTAPAAPAWGINSTEEPWPTLSEELEENSVPPAADKKKKEADEPSKSRRKRKGRSRGKHGSKKQASESNGRELSPSPPPNDSSTGHNSDSRNGNVQSLQKSSSLSSSTSSISDDANGKEDAKDEDLQHETVQVATETSPPPVNLSSESFDWQTAFGFKSESLTNGSKNMTLCDEDEEDDDLGFDPFAETQKGLAELMESEKKQQQQHRLQQSRSMTTIQQQQTTTLQQLFRASELHRHTSHLDLPYEIDARPPPPPGFNGPSLPFNRPMHQRTNEVGHHADLGTMENASSPFSRILGNKDIKPPSQPNFSFSDWQALLPNLGSSYLNNGAHRSTPAQQRPVQNDWTAMDPAIMAASACPRAEPSWGLMEQNSLFPSSSSRTNLGWPGKLAPPPGFSRPF
ncbi:CCR4-NOT transcription complex subunit 4-like isoform X2 [Neocloeon triangulifer]|uniref:CCR4-NOT transcription complex subunit 4-like isoform X2 n=1 Tax=Neocloeon triangulifer TaxID=2078957 RepID=UPI00286EE199|nr:CCR4-NOT transcription complex subunit 4-like isoform X2 [Neocloeon triangulifer]